MSAPQLQGQTVYISFSAEINAHTSGGYRERGSRLVFAMMTRPGRPVWEMSLR
jgi:hypothetical protein